MNESLSVFAMRGSRKAVSQGLQHIEAQVTAIEDAVTSNPGLAFDLAKTLVESVCRTILTERGGAWAERDDLPRLFQEVRNILPVLPPHESQESEVRQSIYQTVNGLYSAVQGIAELRNKLGFASHGSDSHRPSMGVAHAEMAAQAADTIVGFLYDVHRQDSATASSTDSPFTSDSDFDEYLDGEYQAVNILGIEFLPSEILFEIEPESYRALLEEFLVQDWTADE